MTLTSTRSKRGAPGAFTSGLALLGLLAHAGATGAYDFSLGDVEVAFDSTLSFGVQLRTETPDKKNYCTTIGRVNLQQPPPVVPDGAGSGPGVNADCGKSAGNLNYEKWSPVSTVLKGVHELDVSWRNYGLFGRFNWWYDGINEHGDRARTPLTSDAKFRVGAGAELLDAYLHASWYPGDVPVSLKLGNQVVSWGESTFIQNGINVINPVDVSKLRVPGAELREALKGVPILWASVSPTESLSFEGFYQFWWQRTIIDPPGSFFSTHDALGPGGNFFDISQGHHDCDIGIFGGLAPPPAVVPGTLPFGFRQDGSLGQTCIARGKDKESRNHGQFGLAARLFVSELNASEFGLFFINFHSRVPYVGGSFRETLQQAVARLVASGVPPGQAALLGVGVVIGGAQANQFYPEDIQKIGASFSTTVDSISTAIQGEFAYTIDQPMQISEIQLLRGLFASAGLPGGAVSPGVTLTFPGLFFEGAVLKDMVTAQTTFTYVGEPGPIIGGWLRASQLLAVGEIGYLRVVDYDDSGFLPLQGSVTPQWGPGQGYTAYQFSSFGSRNSMGYVVRAGLVYNNLVFGANVTPSIGWQHDFWGVTPAPVGNFIEGRKAVNVAVTVDFLNAWSGSIGYASYFGGGVDNPLNDRDFLSFDIKYSF